MNVLVMGTSGSGKTTLIKSVAGIVSNSGESTKNIDVYESNIWPIRCIDTKGFEYKLLEQMKTINQIKKYTKEQIKKSKKNNISNMGIDVVWYCIEGTSKRTFEYNIKLMNKALKTWKNIPVIVVITKSYSETDIKENMTTIKNVFKKEKNINLKKIIPVVALEYVIDSDTTVFPKGIEELCVETLNYTEEAHQIKLENMILEQKKKTANKVVLAATTSAMVVGIVPIKIPDATLLVPIETGLTKKIFKIYEIDYSESLIHAVIGSTIITEVAKFIVHSIPIVGPVINSVVAGVTVYALGQGIIKASTAIVSGKLDPTKIDETVEFIRENTKNNEIIESTINYFKNNKDENLKPSEILKKISSKK